MQPRSLRRRSLALVALGFVFLTLGIRHSTRHHSAYVPIAICFFVAGAALRRRARL